MCGMELIPPGWMEPADSPCCCGWSDAAWSERPTARARGECGLCPRTSSSSAARRSAFGQAGPRHKRSRRPRPRGGLPSGCGYGCGAGQKLARGVGKCSSRRRGAAGFVASAGFCCGPGRQRHGSGRLRAPLSTGATVCCATVFVPGRWPRARARAWRVRRRGNRTRARGLGAHAERPWCAG